MRPFRPWTTHLDRTEVRPSGTAGQPNGSSTFSTGTKGEQTMLKALWRGWLCRPISFSFLQIGALIGVFVLLYSSVLRDLAGIWWTRDDYSHGFLILPISLYLVWAKRPELGQLPVKPNGVWGLCLLVAAGILLLLGMAARVLVLSGVSFVAMIVGLVLLLLGNAYVKALAFPIGYIVLMIPIFDEVLAPLQWPLQLLTASMSGQLLQMLGVSALVEQQYIVLPRTTLEVATLCSGTNYLISIIAIGLPLAYLTLRTWGSRVALMLFAVAVGVSANWVRVALIG